MKLLLFWKWLFYVYFMCSFRETGFHYKMDNFFFLRKTWSIIIWCCINSKFTSWIVRDSSKSNSWLSCFGMKLLDYFLVSVFCLYKNVWALFGFCCITEVAALVSCFTVLRKGQVDTPVQTDKVHLSLLIYVSFFLLFLFCMYSFVKQNRDAISRRSSINSIQSPWVHSLLQYSPPFLLSLYFLDSSPLLKSLLFMHPYFSPHLLLYWSSCPGFHLLLFISFDFSSTWEYFSVLSLYLSLGPIISSLDF